jgi:tetratricopeptide (TPR) repeat protein
LELKPGYAEAYVNLGNNERSQGRLEQAIQRYDQALRLNPDYVEAQWSRSLVELLVGDFDRGWRDYESRHRRKKNAPRDFPQPIWRGEPLNGERILLHSEQGFGDSIQLLRYVPLVQAVGGRVILDVPSSLLRLAAGIPGCESVVATEEQPPPFDWHCPLMSLPLAFKTSIATIPSHVPYLKAPEQAKRDADKIKWVDHDLRVGLVWSGNPKYAEDRNRSISLSQFSSLIHLEGVQFYSLQMGPAASQLGHVGIPVVDLQSAIQDMADTAAMIAQLDLVITVDTSVAHLAGSLAKPTWVLLPYAPDWRWLMDRQDSPWYPTVRLFRQPKFGDWQSVMERVGSELSSVRGTW